MYTRVKNKKKIQAAFVSGMKLHAGGRSTKECPLPFK